MIAATVGSLDGIGGGVIIRPALDAFNSYDNANIANFLSSFCVLAVALTSVIKSVITKQKIDKHKSSILSDDGSIIGGIIGNFLFDLVNTN